MKNANEKRARIIRRLELQLEILETQMKLWELRAKAKRGRIAEVQREIQERRK